MQKHFSGEKLKLLYTDTDSLIYEIETEDFYLDIKPILKDNFDTSNFPDNHPSGIERINKKVLGMMKFECAGKQIINVICFRAKCYEIEDNIVTKKCKGIKKYVIDADISYNYFYHCLFNEIPKNITMNIIITYKQELFSERRFKNALDPTYNKIIISNDGINTYAHGHYKTKTTI